MKSILLLPILLTLGLYSCGDSDEVDTPVTDNTANEENSIESFPPGNDGSSSEIANVPDPALDDKEPSSVKELPSNFNISIKKDIIPNSVRNDYLVYTKQTNELYDRWKEVNELQLTSIQKQKEGYLYAST